MTLDPEFIGHTLLKRGFKDWFLAMFKIVENRDFIIEPIHNDLFQTFQDIYDGKVTRICINLPPRAGKTVMSKYFTVFTITNNPKSNIIYTSYSQALLGTIANEVMGILENPVYKKMYPIQYEKTQQEENATNDYWQRIAEIENKEKKNTYSSRRIVTAQGGTIIFNSMGASITGFGFSVRNSEKFSGFLIQDDPNKISEMRSEVYRENVVRYYEETLLSRANSPNAPIICLQQRCHLEDLSGVLENKYKFQVLKKPLLDENGVCQIPSQYTPERIKELQMNNYMFSAQFLQNPIVLGGEVIKREWFRYYPIIKEYKYKRILITADTAIKTKEYNDYSVFIASGVTADNKLHILKVLRGKWEAPELEKMAVTIWNEFKRNPKTGLACSGFYIEDKSSGCYLIQSLKAKYGIPVIGIQVDKDKLTRVENILTYLESGQVFLPENENYDFNIELIKECESFSRDGKHKRDDQTDALCYAIQEGIGKTKVSLLDYFME